ncbi:MAG: hypothetical protein EA394_05690 [Bacteroidia bacterium]|nr:MAG: hypothetical protein EA394_05690 [Bacteroidia bacterium]
MNALLKILYIYICLLMYILPVSSAVPEAKNAPEKKVGLTLSGGGARGLAHIGVLHIIDSLGVQIDYITGTSIGSIVGGMYASGYSALEIEEFALSMDWEMVFSRRAELSFVHPMRRDHHQQHIVELPIEHGRIRTPTGAIEGQKLWNTLNEVFFHTHHITDFNDLDIPFACVATNVENGDAIVMRDGNLVTAIRASMAIPSVFTTVERDGMKLIDGGVVNNFPARLAKEMGADFVIGINVSQGLRPAEELITPIDIIYQMGFYSDAKNFADNRAATDVFVDVDLGGFTAASFANTFEIIERGKEAGRKIIDDLLPLAGSKAQPGESIREKRAQIELVIDTIIISGLENVKLWYAHNTLNIGRGDTVGIERLTRAINKLYASNYFNRVHYHLKPLTDKGSVILHIDVSEKPFTSLAAALHFGSFTGAAISARIRTNKFVIYNAEASASVVIGEQPAFKGSLIYFFDERRRTWSQYQVKGRRLTFPIFDDFEPFAEYNQAYFRNEISVNRLYRQNAFFSLATAYYFESLSPNMRTPTTIDIKNRAFETSLGWHYHTLNRNVFPTSGQRIQVNSSFIYNQNPSVSEIRLDGRPASLEDLDIEISNFFQFYLLSESYIPLWSNLTQINKLQIGYSFGYDQGFINSFNIGGTYHLLKNQITFAGLNEYELISPNIVAASLGYQYHFGRSVYATGLFNAALYEFRLDRPEEISSDNFVLGAGVSLGYDTILGPFELTFSYSPQAGKIIGYINLGWLF